MKLQGQVAIVTAAGRGIGKGIALALATEGARLVVNSFSEETLANTVDAIKELGAEVISLSGDITDPLKMIALRDLALSEYGQIDILVNNVGAGPKQSEKPPEHELGLTRLGMGWLIWSKSETRCIDDRGCNSSYETTKDR